MFLILKSIPLSLIVALRMIMPLIAIFVVSAIISSILGILTLGLSTLITGPATLAFIALFGMHVALDQKRQAGLLDLREMISYSVVFGLTLSLFKLIGIGAVLALSVLAAQQNLGLELSFKNLIPANENLETAFSINVLSFLGLFSLIVLAAIEALFAVPMAAAAHSAGHKFKRKSFEQGFGKSFLPLFVIAAISLFLQFFFQIFSVFILVFFTFAFQITWFVETAGERISENGMDGLIELLGQIDPTATLIALASVFVVIWLQAWIWSAAALAFLKHNDTEIKRPVSTRQVPAVTPTDLRALRKARDNRTK